MSVDPLYDGRGSIFFNNQYVYKEDLNNIEYSKFRTIRRSLAAFIGQAGVAIDSLTNSALKVEYIDSKHFTVNPGTAIDEYGRIIYVPDSVSVYGSIIADPEYHPAYPTRETIAHNKIPSVSTRYYVNIYYGIQQDIIEVDNVGVSHYTRMYDSYEIACENFTAGSGSSRAGICLGSFEVDTSGNIRFGAITDLRPLLEMLSAGEASGSYTTSQRVFSKTNIASSTIGATVSGFNQWAANASDQQTKAYIGYVHREGAVAMDIRFCVPTSSQAPADAYLYVYIYACDGSLATSGYANVTTNNYIQDLNLDISGLSPGVYYIQIDMKTLTETGTFYVKDLVVDVS